MAPVSPRTRAAAPLRMKQIAFDNQSHTIRRLRAKLETERGESAATKEGLETKVSSLERELQIQRCDNHSLRNTVTLYHKDIDRRISQLVEAKKEHKTNQLALEASHKTIAGLNVLEPNWKPREESQLLPRKDWKLRYPAWKENYKSRDVIIIVYEIR
ncbi:pleiotropic drug resistance protein 3-like [Dorcoceras hygrometricum]|uniref:Pleiotropic drug resistance protein 3-like n=1 Tax=Dorcoceras hygrometricum TaxID=472368 RepID=A0A2Z7DBK1_9LAMI|nr:pleiotropic drug resistance protein 3-like [Dorcoceras hygrometricum]